MNENIEKHIEELANKIMKDSKLESPTLGFTATIMSQVETVSQSEITKYKPLISKRNWVVLIVLFVVLFGLSIFGTSSETISWLETVDFSILTNNRVSGTLSKITISNTVLYAVVFFGVALFIQIPMLKNYFDKRLEF